jgi:hypothetical protein
VNLYRAEKISAQLISVETVQILNTEGAARFLLAKYPITEKAKTTLLF